MLERDMGLPLYPAEFLEPEFYAIPDWKNPQASAVPEWWSMHLVGGSYYFAHPSVIGKLKEGAIG